MLSKIVKLAITFTSEVFGTLILTATIFGMFYTVFLNQGIMRIVGPLIALAGGIAAYVVIMLIAHQLDKTR
ncbi:hypothetical protein [Pseudescherichia sp.]|uniref:hypothetical protein n=1 Tax=Pseudescherichia sp. TaxID=2055881 RepID=UPI00289740A1|nr:hypothetical protein [Pseudescherichia sp.]WPO94099.1 hypothetical protein SFA32_14135 [Buttiauxella sp. HR94]